jgi:hypothetical protein
MHRLASAIRAIENEPGLVRRRLMLPIQAALLAMIALATPALTQSRGLEPLPLSAPLKSGVCGLCGAGRCSASSYRCVRIFDPARGGLLQNLACNEAGEFRAQLPAGRYALDRTGVGFPLSNVRDAEEIEIRSGQWTRLDGVSPARCPDSGVYGWDYRPCTGVKLSGSYTCAWAMDPRTGRMVASAQCEKGYPTFVMPLPPGRYTVKSSHSSERTIEVRAGQWQRVGAFEAPPCLPIP